MTLGLHAVNLADKWLDVLGNTTFTGITTVYAQLHDGDPGSAGTANASAETTRVAITWAAASGGSKAMSGTLAWEAWDAGTEAISHVSLWTAASAGSFLWSGALDAPVTVNDTDDLTLTSLTAAITPLAA